MLFSYSVPRIHFRPPVPSRGVVSAAAAAVQAAVPDAAAAVGVADSCWTAGGPGRKTEGGGGDGASLERK